MALLLLKFNILLWIFVPGIASREVGISVIISQPANIIPAQFHIAVYRINSRYVSVYFLYTGNILYKYITPGASILPECRLWLLEHAGLEQTWHWLFTHGKSEDEEGWQG